MTSKYPILDDIKVPDKELENWQITIDLLAEIAEIPAALIMRVHAREIEVLLSSNSPGNVYHPGEKAQLDSGLYCETVMSSRKKLLVPNALKDPVWDHNPDIELGMISYCGIPLTWPNGEIFGTICILDNKENSFNHRGIPLLERFRDSIQVSLENVYRAYLERGQMGEELVESEALYKALVDTTGTGYVIIDTEGRVVDANAEYVRLSGHRSLNEIRGRSVLEWTADYEMKNNADAVAQCAADGYIRNLEIDYTDQHGTITPIEVNATVVKRGGTPQILAMCRDITERKRNEAINAARLHLIQFSVTHSLDEILEETVNEAEKLTSSLIGFYHFVEADQKSLSLQNWSTRTKAEFCKSEGKGAHYDIAAAGVWVDCVYQRKPVIHNDYATLPHRKGMPEGHAPVVRELVAPVIRAEKITAILGVGNKPADYNQQDVEAISLLVDLAWEIAERKRAEVEIRELNEELERKVRARTAELEAKIAEIERLNRIFVGRELRMVELKERIMELEGKAIPEG